MSFNRLFASGLELFATTAFNWLDETTYPVSAALVDNTYTINPTNTNRSEIGSAVVSSLVSLGERTYSNGILSITSSTLVFPSVTSPNPIQGFAVFRDTGTALTDTLIGFINGRMFIRIRAGSTGTSVAVDPRYVLAGIDNGAVLTRISGTGASTITLGASASANAATLTANASVTVVEGDIYSIPYTGNGFPTGNPSGGNVTTTITGAGLFRLQLLGV